MADTAASSEAAQLSASSGGRRLSSRSASARGQQPSSETKLQLPVMAPSQQQPPQDRPELMGNVSLSADIGPARLAKKCKERKRRGSAEQHRQKTDAHGQVSPAGGKHSEEDTSTYSSLGSLPSDFDELCNNSNCQR